MRRWQKFVMFVVSILVLFLATQATRFENQVTVTYSDGNFTVVIGENGFSLPVQENFSQVTVQLHKSMLDENGVGEFSISSDNQVLAEYKPLVIHLFGKDMIGTLIRGTYPNFKKTFGDWTMDRSMSRDVLLYNVTLPSHFSAHFTLVGRGYKYFTFHGKKNVLININDGFLDNDYFTCYGDNCIRRAKEFIFTNVKRISNFFLEALLLATIIIFFIKLISKRAR